MRKHGWLILVVTALVVGVAAKAWTFPAASQQTKLACGSCHTGVAGGALTDGGKAWKADNTKLPAAAATAATYVGSNKCKMCHMKEHKAWSTTAHATAMNSLLKGDDKVAAELATKAGLKLEGKAAQSESCVGCHVTGNGLAGGFAVSDTTKMANFGAVGCETCHGPGSLHVSAPKEEKAKMTNKAVSEVYCKHCHTPAFSPNFKYDEYKAKGVHVVAAN